MGSCCNSRDSDFALLSDDYTRLELSLGLLDIPLHLYQRTLYAGPLSVDKIGERFLAYPLGKQLCALESTPAKRLFYNTLTHSKVSPMDPLRLVALGLLYARGSLLEKVELLLSLMDDEGQVQMKDFLTLLDALISAACYWVPSMAITVQNPSLEFRFEENVSAMVQNEKSKLFGFKTKRPSDELKAHLIKHTDYLFHPVLLRRRFSSQFKLTPEERKHLSRAETVDSPRFTRKETPPRRFSVDRGSPSNTAFRARSFMPLEPNSNKLSSPGRSYHNELCLAFLGGGTRRWEEYLSSLEVVDTRKSTLIISTVVGSGGGAFFALLMAMDVGLAELKQYFASHGNMLELYDWQASDLR